MEVVDIQAATAMQKKQEFQGFLIELSPFALRDVLDQGVKVILNQGARIDDNYNSAIESIDMVHFYFCD